MATPSSPTKSPHKAEETLPTWVQVLRALEAIAPHEKIWVKEDGTIENYVPGYTSGLGRAWYSQGRARTMEAIQAAVHGYRDAPRLARATAGLNTNLVLQGLARLRDTTYKGDAEVEGQIIDLCRIINPMFEKKSICESPGGHAGQVGSPNGEEAASEVEAAAASTGGASAGSSPLLPHLTPPVLALASACIPTLVLPPPQQSMPEVKIPIYTASSSWTRTADLPGSMARVLERARAMKEARLEKSPKDDAAAFDAAMGFGGEAKSSMMSEAGEGGLGTVAWGAAKEGTAATLDPLVETIPSPPSLSPMTPLSPLSTFSPHSFSAGTTSPWGSEPALSSGAGQTLEETLMETYGPCFDVIM